MRNGFSLRTRNARRNRSKRLFKNQLCKHVVYGINIKRFLSALNTVHLRRVLPTEHWCCVKSTFFPEKNLYLKIVLSPLVISISSYRIRLSAERLQRFFLGPVTRRRREKRITNRLSR